MHAAPDRRLRSAHAAQRLGLRSQQHEQRLLHRSVERSQRGARLSAGLHDGRARQPGVPGATCSARSIRPTRASSSRPRSTATSFRARAASSTASPPAASTGGKPGTYFTFPYFIYAPRAGFAWNMFGDGKTALRGSWGIFYNFPRSTGRRRLSVLRRLPDLLHASDPLGDVRRHHDGDAGQPDREPGQRHRRRLRAAAREVAQRQHGVPARHRLQHRRRDRLRRQLHEEPRPLRRRQPAAALRVRQPGQPGEQRAGHRQLAAAGVRAVSRAWARSTQYVPGSLRQDAAYNALQLQVAAPAVQRPADGPGVHARQGRRLSRATTPTPTRSAAKRRSGRATGDRRPTIAGTTWSINYSYDIPTFIDAPVLKQLLSDWQISGVDADAERPGDHAELPARTTPGIDNTNPSLTDGFCIDDATRAAS